jgi:RimJ/RimL family protein N-acetyltransferase
MAEPCIIRPHTLEDAPSLARHGNSRKIWLNLRDRFPHPYVEDDARAYIGYLIQVNAASNFVIDVDGEAIGGIVLHPREDIERIGAEVGYWIGEAFWGRGIATHAIRLITAHAFEERKLERVFAIPFVHNAGSCRALEKAGYEREGLMRRSAIKDGQILDQYLYARTVS